MAITDGSQRLRADRNSAGEKASNLFDQTRFKHPFHAGIDATVTLVTGRIQPDREDDETLQRPTSLLFEMFCQRFARFQPNLESPNDLGLVPLRDSAGRLRIKPPQ